MVRLIDPAIEKLSKTINEMGQDAITCFSLAVDSYLEDRETAPQVHDLSEKIRKNYYSVEDQIFDIMLKYQPIAEDFDSLDHQQRFHMHIQDLADMHTTLQLSEKHMVEFLNV